MERPPKTEDEKKAVAGFEKLWVWQKAFKLMQEVHTVCKHLPRDERFRLRDRIERSSASVCDNIAEGYTSYYLDKIKGFNRSKRSRRNAESYSQVMR